MRLTSKLITLTWTAALAAPFGLMASVAPAGAAAMAPAGQATAGLARAARAATSQWPQFGQSARHLSTNPAEKAFNTGNVSRMRTLFTADFGSNTTTEGGPAVANGVVYQGGFDGNLNAYPASGCGQSSCQPIWQGKAANDFTSTPAVAGGVAYVGDFHGHLYAFKAAGCGTAVCAPLWVGHGFKTELIGAPAAGNGFVYVTTFLDTPDLFTGRLLVFPAAGCGKPDCTPSWTASIGGPAGS